MHFLSKYLLIVKNNRTVKSLVNNVFNFSIFQLTNYLVPLITIPYIVRTIGVEKFGILSIALAIIQYFLIVVDYGFDISGTQKVAQASQDNKKLSLIFNSIIIIKVLIASVCFVFLLLLAKIFTDIGFYFELYIYTFLSIPAQILLSLWFFTAIEKTKYLNYINFVSRLIYLVGILLIVKSESDFILIPLINSVSLFLAGLYSYTIIIKKFDIEFTLPSLKDISYFIKDGWNIFLSNLFITLYRNSNIVILGLFVSNQLVGYYSAGEKLIKILQSIFIPINRVMYPFISRTKIAHPEESTKYIKYMVLIMGAITLAISLLLIVFAEPVTILVFGNEFVMTIKVIQIGGLAMFFGMINYIIGIIYMLNYNMKKQFFISVAVTGVLNVIFCTLFVILWQERGAALAFAGAEFILTLLFSFFIFRNNRKNPIISTGG